MVRLHTNQESKQRKGNSLALALLFLMLCLVLAPFQIEARTNESQFYNSATVNPDTNIVKYDLNDPRNPDCPCHAAQKLADEEFRRSQHQDNNIQHDQNPTENNRGGSNDISRDINQQNNNVDLTNQNANKPTYSGGSGGSQKHYSKYYKFQKKMKRWSKKVNRKLKSKNKGIKGGKIRVADCMH